MASLSRFIDYAQTRTRLDSTEEVISPSQKIPPAPTHQTREKNIHGAEGFELSLPANKRLQTYALDHMATRIEGLTILQVLLPDAT
jgi:hypothetical protein